MQNRFKLPSDVKRMSFAIIQGYRRRKRQSKYEKLSDYDIQLINCVSSSLDEVCADVQNEALNKKLKSALLSNCESKKNTYEYFYLPGISRNNFYQRKSKLVYLVAKKSNFI